MLAVDEIPALTPAQRDAWLRRIGLDTAPPPTLASLNALIAAQLTYLPFENLNALVGRRVAIDLPSVFDKLVQQGRGGYCFELNTLFCAGLKALGYAVVPLAARVRWSVPPAAPTGLSHMLLRVEVAHESHIADVGFGGPTPDRALPLSAPTDGSLPYRLIPMEAGASGTAFHTYELAARNTDATDDNASRHAGGGGGGGGGGDDGSSADAPDAWRAMYRFDLTPQPQIDFVARNWYVSTHPDSHFTQMLIAARTMPDGKRLALGNANLSERAPDGSVAKTVLDSVDAILDVLANRFDIRLDDDLHNALAARLPAALAAR